jgi:hypothetical protein
MELLLLVVVVVVVVVAAAAAAAAAAVAECYEEGCHANMVWCKKKSVACLSQFVLSPPQINENVYFSSNQFSHSLYVNSVCRGCHEVAQENIVFCFKTVKWV